MAALLGMVGRQNSDKTRQGGMRMATTKLMHMKTAKSGNKSSHLKNAIDYILKKEKVAVMNGTSLSGTNACLLSDAYNNMMDTKRAYGKNDGRQGYHFVISFKPGQASVSQVYEITRDFVKEYLGEYECVFAVHDDQPHKHGHVVFNSVSYKTGLKYHYANGDWEREIQPIIDRLCIGQGLPPLEYHVDFYENEKETRQYYHYVKNFNWTKEIKSDIDECIQNSRSWADFISSMKGIGYRFNFGKSVSIRKPGMGRARRLKEKTMGFSYTPEGIVERINFRTGKTRLTTLPPELKNIKSSPEDIKTALKYKKYKDMSFEEKVMIRHVLRIKNVIPEYKNYPGSFMAKRKADELQRASRELLLIKQYGIHSVDDMKALSKELSDVERELKQLQKTEDLKMEQLQEVIQAYELLEKDSSYVREEEKNNREQRDRAKEIIRQSPYDRTTINKYVSEYELNSEKTKETLKKIKKQKAALSRIRKKYGDAGMNKNTQTQEVKRNGRNRIN